MSNNVPNKIQTVPKSIFLENRSLNTILEKTRVTIILNLSIETTTLVKPSCNAL